MFDKLLKQPMMNRVLYALLPSMIFSIYLFGWKVFAIVLVANVAAYLTEYAFVYKKKGGKVSTACFVTGTLVAMTLPPTIPLWISAVGSIVSIAFGKMVFGGFGTNPFNPAILGRTFIYVSFPQQLTVSWVKPFILRDFPGGFFHWTAPQGMLTSATVLGQYRLHQQVSYNFSDAFWGFVPGSLGETSAFLIILAALYLVISKTAKWETIIGTTASILLFNILFYPAENPLFLLMTGGAIFGIVYMTTDPVSQSKGKFSIWIYSLMIGFLTVYIRKFSLFAEGFMFALLLTNSVMPIVEYALDKYLLKGKNV